MPESPWRIEKVRGWQEIQALSRNAPRRVQDVVRGWTKDVAKDEAKYIRYAAPSKTGRFRSTIEPYARATVVGVEFKPYPRLGYKLVGWIREGTPPHIIRARRAKALHFIWKGKERFFRLVHHPGTKPNDFVLKGARKFEKRLPFWLDELGKRIVKALGG